MDLKEFLEKNEYRAPTRTEHQRLIQEAIRARKEIGFPESSRIYQKIILEDGAGSLDLVSFDKEENLSILKAKYIEARKEKTNKRKRMTTKNNLNASLRRAENFISSRFNIPQEKIKRIRIIQYGDANFEYSSV
ncbi:MAG: hypothetical protein ABIG28_01415 [archaeon]